MECFFLDTLYYQTILFLEKNSEENFSYDMVS